MDGEIARYFGSPICESKWLPAYRVMFSRGTTRVIPPRAVRQSNLDIKLQWAIANRLTVWCGAGALRAINYLTKPKPATLIVEDSDNG